MYAHTYYHLRLIRPTLQSLSRYAAKTLVQAFISSRLDYCNSVLDIVTDNVLQRLQSVQNAATRLIMRTGRHEYISPVLQELHWLPVWRHFDYKLATLMFKSLHGCSPSLGRLQVSAWGQSPSPLVWRHHMCHTVVQNSSGWEVVWCRRTAALEQAACFTAVVWQSLPLQKTVESVFVCQGLGCGA